MWKKTIEEPVKTQLRVWNIKPINEMWKDEGLQEIEKIEIYGKKCEWRLRYTIGKY